MGLALLGRCLVLGVGAGTAASADGTQTGVKVAVPVGTKGRVLGFLCTVLILGITGPLPLFLAAVRRGEETPTGEGGGGG